MEFHKYPSKQGKTLRRARPIFRYLTRFRSVRSFACFNNNAPKLRLFSCKGLFFTRARIWEDTWCIHRLMWSKLCKLNLLPQSPYIRQVGLNSFRKWFWFDPHNKRWLPPKSFQVFRTLALTTSGVRYQYFIEFPAFELFLHFWYWRIAWFEILTNFSLFFQVKENCTPGLWVHIITNQFILFTYVFIIYLFISFSSSFWLFTLIVVVQSKLLW